MLDERGRGGEVERERWRDGRGGEVRRWRDRRDWLERWEKDEAEERIEPGTEGWRVEGPHQIHVSPGCESQQGVVYLLGHIRKREAGTETPVEVTPSGTQAAESHFYPLPLPLPPPPCFEGGRGRGEG